MAASAAIVSFLTIGNHSISAQTPVSTEQTDSKTDDIIGKDYSITISIYYKRNFFDSTRFTYRELILKITDQKNTLKLI